LEYLPERVFQWFVVQVDIDVTGHRAIKKYPRSGFAGDDFQNLFEQHIDEFSRHVAVNNGHRRRLAWGCGCCGRPSRRDTDEHQPSNNSRHAQVTKQSQYAFTHCGTPTATEPCIFPTNL
jgi:hypothetical protein